MKIIIVIAILIVTALCRLNSTSQECQVYLNKLDTIIYDDYIVYNENTSQIIVTFGYYDPLYSNETYFGLTQEDGKPLDQTCLDLQFFVFTSTQTDLMVIEDKNLTNSNITNWRFLSFKIQEQQIKSQIVPNEYTYTVYFSVIYTIHDTEIVHHVQKFNFTILLSSSSNSLFQFPDSFIIQEQQKIKIDVVTEMKWCTDQTCTVNTVPDIELNDQFYIQQAIVQSGKSQYYLTETTVAFRGDALNKLPRNPVIIKNTVKGQALLFITADIAWSELNIEVDSYISLNQDGTNRLLMQNKITESQPLMNCQRFLALIIFIYIV